MSRAAGRADQLRRIRLPSQVRAAGGAITRWGEETGAGSRRPDLPWRSSRDPWAVLVSEVMAQQTQLSRVIPAYRRFVALFPTPVHCAGASLGDVLRAWQGLGYNRRARDLHRAALVLTNELEGRVPAELDALLALPGVGPYTARAVLAFAFGADVGVVDTNTARVLSRAVAGRPLKAAEAQLLVDAMVPPGRGWAFGQALLDLGALICVSGMPRCASCPIRSRCRWFSAGRTVPDPARGTAGGPSAQLQFRGSDRQGRGKMVDRLRLGPLGPDELATAAGWPDDPDRATRVASELVADGLAVCDREGALRLP